MAKPLVYNATLTERVDLTDALSLFRITPDERPAPGWFTPGQYCVLGLNNEVKAEVIEYSDVEVGSPEDTTYMPQVR